MFINFSSLKHEISEVPNSSIITKFICQQKEGSSVAEVLLGHAQLRLSDKHWPMCCSLCHVEMCTVLYYCHSWGGVMVKALRY